MRENTHINVFAIVRSEEQCKCKVRGNEKKKKNLQWKDKNGGEKPKQLAAEFEMLSPGWTLFTVNGEIECVAYLMGFVFIVQHWIINWEAACHIDLSFN